MFAVYAAGIDREDPLSVLGVGDLPEPETPDDWVTVHVRAASLNHHDVWALKGQALKAEQSDHAVEADCGGAHGALSSAAMTSARNRLQHARQTPSGRAECERPRCVPASTGSCSSSWRPQSVTEVANET